MSTLMRHLTDDDNHIAEGLPESSGDRETRPAMRTGHVPVIRLSGKQGAPAAEAEVTDDVALIGEGKDNTESQDARRTTAEAAPVSAASEGRRKVYQPTILIIEDNTELAEIIEATLQRLDMVTAHETHGSKGRRRCEEMQPDVLLLDIGLPDTTGWKLLEEMREKRGEDMPQVIVITAYGDPANRLIGKLQNVHDYLIKPFTSDEVERVVLSALGKAVQ